MMSRIGWGGKQNTIYKGVKPSPSRRVLKPWGEAQKGKPEKVNIC